MDYKFGSGVMVGVRTDQANPTPSMMGILQEASVDFAFTNKQLVGQYQFPVAVARGVGKISGKAKFANINAAMFNDLFFQGTLASNEKRVAVAESCQVATNTFTVANAASFLTDLGVYNTVSGRFMTRVASAPAAGQYSVNTGTGVYTFAAADSNPLVQITYEYSFTTTTGKTLTIGNQLLGLNPTFKVVLSQTFNGRQLNLTLNSCTSTKLTIATKLEDFLIPDFDFEAQADASNSIGSMSFAE